MLMQAEPYSAARDARRPGLYRDLLILRRGHGNPVETELSHHRQHNWLRGPHVAARCAVTPPTARASFGGIGIIGLRVGVQLTVLGRAAVESYMVAHHFGEGTSQLLEPSASLGDFLWSRGEHSNGCAWPPARGLRFPRLAGSA